MKSAHCLVIGAGSVGVNLALFLDSYGFRVTLIESEVDILFGAAQVSFINHSDGFEYYNSEVRTTGEHCIEGAFTKALFYPISRISTDVCSQDNPIRFMVAKSAIESGIITREGFESNAEYMMGHYEKKFRALAEAAGFSDKEAERVFKHRPDNFMRMMKDGDFTDVKNIATGAYGSGFGINMPHYYALVKEALRNSSVDCCFGVVADDISKSSGGTYEVKSSQRTWIADHVLVCNSHHIPRLVSSIAGEETTKDFPGTFFLNSMTFLCLPATPDKERQRSVKHVNFTLMDEHGCMYACVVAPTSEEDGLAAIYYPSVSGNQLDSHVCRKGDLSQPPLEWKEFITRGLPNSSSHSRVAFEQACRLYPFLENYAELSHSICRTVFNVGVSGSDDGLRRNVRELSADFHAMTTDGRVSAWTASKWTNAELTALMALDYVLQHNGLPPLPKCEIAGCGPTLLDVAKISGMINPVILGMKSRDAKYYARRALIPERIASSVDFTTIN